MKISTSILVLIMVVAASAFGGKKNSDVVFKGTPVALIERNLAIALRTPIPGMQASASQTVRDLKALLPDQDFSSLVIPLMAILKDKHSDGAVRMIAALALHDLHSGRGDFAIQRTARFTDDPRIARLCSYLTFERSKKERPENQNTAMR